MASPQVAVGRRALLLALALAPAAGRAVAGVSRVPLSDAFLLLEDYLKLPPAQRDRFYLAYRAMRGEKPAPDAKAAYLAPDGTRSPVVFDAAAVVTNPPTLAQIESRSRFETEGPPLIFDLELCASTQPAARLAVVDLTAALTQANQAVARFTGGASGVATLTAAFFLDGGAGQALLASGESAPLPVFEFKSLGKLSYIEPARLPAAQTVSLERTPSRVILSRHPQKG
jgi:hypothetical protein